jgi:HEAT repeat protein
MRQILALVLVTLALVAPLRAGEDPKVDEAQAKLLEVLLDEAKVPERTKAVGDLAALDKPAAARALFDALDKLAARTTSTETRAARTRQDYERYRGAAQASDKDWAVKQRLLEQMEKDDAVLRGDFAVYDAFGAGVAAMKDKESVTLLDKAAVKAELAPTRRVLAGALLRNPATNAKEIAKRAAADSDASVRLAALEAFAERKDPGLLDFAMRALSDPQWTFRQAAARALAAIGDTKAVGPLITAMNGEDGSVLEDYAAALSKLTGANLGPNPDAWKRWYDDHKGELASKGPPPAPVKPGKNPLAPPVDYYGIQTRSLKLLFLIDCSGSMNEEIGKGGTTGDQWTGKKIDIAKKMLKAAVSQLHPSTMFNVITFNTDARQFNEKLVQATPETKHLTLDKIDELAGRGGTYTYGALKLAFGLTDPNVTPSAPPVDTIFLLSDGAPTEATFEEGVEAKPMDPEKILDSVKQWNSFRAVRIYTIAIDPRIDNAKGSFVRLMKALAEQNGGTYTPIGAK